MKSLQNIEKFIKDNIDKYDLEIRSKPSVGGRAIFRACIDNATGGNFVNGGWEFSLEDAFEELEKELNTELTRREQK